MKTIYCMRKDGHVLIFNWNSRTDPSVIEVEIMTLVMLGWRTSELTQKEMLALQLNIGAGIEGN